MTIQVSGTGSADWLTVIACRSATSCPAAKNIFGLTGSLYYSALLPLPLPEGIAKICATVQHFDPVPTPPGQPPRGPFRPVPLGCVSVAPPTTAAVGAFKVTPSIDGLVHEGWFIDLRTDAPAQIVLGRTSNPVATVAALAGGTDSRSLQRWPGFNDHHGFSATLPYAGSPAATQICAWVAPNTGTTLGNPLACFPYQERTAVFSETRVTRGSPLHVSVRNVPSGAAVSVNLKADAGYFMLPWTHPGIWAATADQSGSANINIATNQLPPGSYTVAYHCAPECPGGSLDASTLIGGQPWTGSITLGSTLTVDPGISRDLTATMLSASVIRVTGMGFAAGETIGILVVPPLLNFDGFPSEVSANAYIEVDMRGAFSIDVDVTGLPLTGSRNKVVVLDSSHQPVAAVAFTAP